MEFLRAKNLFLTAILSLACLSARPLRAQFDVADKNFSEGVDYYKAKNYALAMDSFTRALILDSRNHKIQEYIVLTQQAIAHATARPRLDTAELQSIVLRAQEVLQQRRKQEEETLDQLRTAYNDSELHSPQSLLDACRGIDIVLDVSLGDDPESSLIKHYVRSICDNLRQTTDVSIKADDNRINKIRGYLAFCHSDWAEAVREWTAALKKDPQDRQLKKLLNRASRRLAEADRKSQEDLVMNQGVRALELRKFKEAAAAFDSALSLDPYNQKALQLFKQARADFKAQELTAVPEWARLAKESADRRDWIAATGYWLNVLEIDPGNESALRNLAQNKTKLLKELQFITSDGSQKPETTSARDDSAEGKRLYTLGLIQYSQGNLAAARENLQAALRANPHDEYAQKALKRVVSELDIAK